MDQLMSDGSRTFGLNVANVNLKAGLFNNVDLQVVLENYVYERTQAGGVIEQKSG